MKLKTHKTSKLLGFTHHKQSKVSAKIRESQYIVQKGVAVRWVGATDASRKQPELATALRR